MMWAFIFALWPACCGGLLWLFAKRAKSRPARRTWLRVLAGNALVLLFLASFAFSAFEMYYRLVYDSSDSFNFTKTSQRWHARYWRNNGWGVRDNLNYEFQI